MLVKGGVSVVKYLSSIARLWICSPAPPRKKTGREKRNETTAEELKSTIIQSQKRTKNHEEQFCVLLLNVPLMRCSQKREFQQHSDKLEPLASHIKGGWSLSKSNKTTDEFIKEQLRISYMGIRIQRLTEGLERRWLSS